MNGYQLKRIEACLRHENKLKPPELKLLKSIENTPVVPFPEHDEHSLSEVQNSVLNELATRVGR